MPLKRQVFPSLEARLAKAPGSPGDEPPWLSRQRGVGPAADRPQPPRRQGKRPPPAALPTPHPPGGSGA
jgi:hypothetical protein